MQSSLAFAFAAAVVYELCRGGSGDDPRTDKACDSREQV